MSSNFYESIKSAKHAHKPLPLFHCTDGFAAREIAVGGFLKKRYCKTLKASLSYFFYGRSDYMIDRNGDVKSAPQFKHCVFAVAPKVPDGNIHRIFPTDSGGFLRDGGPSKSFFHSSVKIEDLELPPKMTSVGKVVNFFYRNSKRYLDYHPTSSVKLKPDNYEAHSYHKLIKDGDLKGFDERASAIEVTFGVDIPTTDFLVALLPSTLHGSDTAVALKAAGVRVKYYPAFAKSAPHKDHAIAQLKARKFAQRF